MGYTPKSDSGSVFRNDRKREGKQDADFAGSAVVGGVEYWVDMWTKPPKDGKKGFFSISFRAKEPRGQQSQRTAPAGRPQPPQRQRPEPATRQRPSVQPTTREPEYGDLDAPDADPDFSYKPRP